MNISRKTLRKCFFGIIGCIVFYWLLFDTERVSAVWQFIKAMISPFVIGAGIAFVLNVPMRGIENRLHRINSLGLRRAIALLLTFFCVLLVLFLVLQLLLPQLVRTGDKLVNQWPVFYEGIQDSVEDFLAGHPSLTEWLNQNTGWQDFEWSTLLEKCMTFLGDEAGNVLLGALSAIGSVSTGIFNGIIGFVFALYCLFRKEILARQARRILYAFLPERFSDEVVRILRLTSTTFSNFLSGQCLEACVLGCMFAICMLIFRMPYIPLISVIVALCALVPIVGAFVGCILGAGFILVDGDPMKAVWFVVMFLLIQQFEANVIYPKVVGKSVGLPGMWVLVAVAIGGALMGIVGMFVMIPLFSVFYNLLREVTDKRINAKSLDETKLCAQPQWTQMRSKSKKKQKASSDEEAQTTTDTDINKE